MKEIDYETDLKIDPDALDVETLDQPLRFMRYSKLSAEANSAVDRAKEAFAVVEAGLDMKHRKEATAEGIKITEAVINSRVKLDSEYQKAFKEYMDIKYEADILQAAVRAFMQRKDSIENLIRLAQMGYFATPSVPRDLSQEIKLKIAQKANEGIADTKERVRARTLSREAK